MSNEVERREFDDLKKRVAGQAWKDPLDVISWGLGAVALARSYSAGSEVAEFTRYIAKMMKAEAVARFRSGSSGAPAAAAIIFGVAEAIEGAYLGHEINQRVDAYGRQLEKQQRETASATT